ncbi:MAG: preprotein translocase subunit SecG [Lysobacteraceae bacterium]
MMLFLNVIYVLVAIAMIALILLQRGAGAQAGSGFGGGASSTVFGARGASSFLSKTTRWLAIAFFGISLFMAWFASHGGKVKPASEQDLGVVSSAATPAKAPAQLPTAPAQPAPVPAAQPAPAPTAAPSTAAPPSAAPAPAGEKKGG